tara:strand:+ start:105 stop:725 length:621 start_codon:yes stop_codon:yes gene_type:complete
MTPREHKEQEEANKKAQAEKIKALSEDWSPRLDTDYDDQSFAEILRDMEPWRASQDDIPLIIRLVENPCYRTSKIFTGAVDLFAHDCIHILLGRGVLPKDEAFVIGYTMGSSKKMKRWRRNLFMFISKYLYPKEYAFGEEERFVFNLGVNAGRLCDKDLTEVNFIEYMNAEVSYARVDCGVDLDMLRSCYKIERASFADSKESLRL